MCAIRTYTIVAIVVLGLLAAGVFVEAAEQNSKYEQLLEKLENLTPGDTVEVRMGTEKDQYDVGDPFEVRFWASEDCYIVLMDISTDGTITFLTPSRLVPDNQIEGGRVYSSGIFGESPSEEKAVYDLGMQITVAPPKGIETLNLFCSPQKLELFDTDFAKAPFYTIAPDDEERITDFMNRLDRLEQLEWSGASVHVRIGPETGLTRAVPKKHGALPGIGSTGSTGKFFPPIGTSGSTGKTEEAEPEEE
jgi:hypothetical protein